MASPAIHGVSQTPAFPGAPLSSRKSGLPDLREQAGGGEGMECRRARAFQTTGPAERWLKSLIAATDFTRRAIFASK